MIGSRASGFQGLQGMQTGGFMSRPGLYGGFGACGQENMESGSTYGSYGTDYPGGGLGSGGPNFKSDLFARQQRLRLNGWSIAIALVVPWMFFCSIYALMSFKWRYTSPALCWLLADAGLAAVLALGVYVLVTSRRKWLPLLGYPAAGGSPRAPSWLAFIFLSSLVAWVMAVIAADQNHKINLAPYYDYLNLNMHVEVDPARMRGQQLMDAGRVAFTNTSVLDITRSMGFKNLDTYCVAPITMQSSAGTKVPLQSYDFWAVGLDCCQTQAADFHCGAFNNPEAHSGLRLLRDDQRDFYRLAVQQAEAAYNIKATHPLFFYWTSDATAEAEMFEAQGYKFLFVGMLAHFAWQLLTVAFAAASFAKLGKY